MTSRPTQSELTTILSVVQAISDGADHLLLQGYGQNDAVKKRDGSLVTITDQTVDEYITAEIIAAFPGHAILSEECNTTYDPSVRYTWVVDPLDGTTNFTRGLPIWGLSIALLLDGVPLLGVLSFSLLRERYWALAGSGAYRNNQLIHTSVADKYTSDHFLMLCTRTQRRYAISSPLKARILGSAAYHLAAVACGSALAGIEATPKLWDIAAGLLLIQQAGGSYKSLDGPSPIFPIPSTTKNYESVSFPLLTAANEAILDQMEESIERKFQ